MRSRVNQLLVRRLARGAIATVCFAVLPVSAQENPPGAVDDRWIPSLAIQSGVIFGRQHGSVSSDCRAPGTLVPTSCDPAPDEVDYGTVLRPGEVDDELVVTPYVGGNLSLLTPALATFGKPRIFVGVELPYQFAIDRNVAQKQRPTGIREPEDPNVGEAIDEGGLLGVGSRTASEIQGLTFGANAGISFAFELLGRKYRVKPAFAWLREEIQVRGRIEQGICSNIPNVERDDCDVDGVKDPGFPNAFTRVITLKGHDSMTLDGIGPALDLEMETGRFGPYTVSLFVGVGGYYLLSDRSLAFSATRTIGPDQLGSAVDYHADWSFHVNPWLYRGGIGLRLSWVGYD